MNKKAPTYQRLGNYIRLVDVRNKDLEVEKLLGLSIEKRFIPSIANTIGTDMSTYKVVQPRQFAYGPVTSRNGDKITIALYDGEMPIIISQAYVTFEIFKPEELDAEYLMMWFRRPEFDRYARFKSHGSAREIFDWETMCDVELPVPYITEQRQIVAEYQTLQNRISVETRLIASLQSTAQAIYRKMFVDDIDKENLPEGWRMGTLGEVVNISGGGTPNTNEPLFWQGDIPFFTPADSSNEYFCISTEKTLTISGLNNCNSKQYDKYSTFVTARGTVGSISIAGKNMAMNQSCYALIPQDNKNYFYIHQLSMQTIKTLKEEAVGAVFSALVTKDFETKEIIIPTDKCMIKYNDIVKSLYEYVLIKQQEINKLKELQSLLLAKMGRKK